MKLHEIKSRKIKTGTPSKLGCSTVYRTEKPDAYFKGKAIWGKGKYFSLTKDDSRKINAGTDNDIKEVELPDSLKLMDFDLTWSDHDRSSHDYDEVHKSIDRAPSGIDGFVIHSNSMQYGYSQVVIFPHAQDKVKYGN